MLSEGVRADNSPAASAASVIRSDEGACSTDSIRRGKAIGQVNGEEAQVRTTPGWGNPWVRSRTIVDNLLLLPTRRHLHPVAPRAGIKLGLAGCLQRPI